MAKDKRLPTIAQTKAALVMTSNHPHMPQWAVVRGLFDMTKLEAIEICTAHDIDPETDKKWSYSDDH